jgi:hypothetical protein
MQKSKTIESEKDLRARLKTLPIDNNETRNRVVCALIGHSRICTMFMEYRYCGRCGDQVGDGLASIDYGRETSVVIGHACSTCRANYKSCTWKDKVFVANPFPKKRKRGEA